MRHGGCTGSWPRSRELNTTPSRPRSLKPGMLCVMPEPSSKRLEAWSIPGDAGCVAGIHPCRWRSGGAVPSLAMATSLAAQVLAALGGLTVVGGSLLGLRGRRRPRLKLETARGAARGIAPAGSGGALFQMPPEHWGPESAEQLVQHLEDELKSQRVITRFAIVGGLLGLAAVIVGFWR